jgi:hypothetical protein
MLLHNVRRNESLLGGVELELLRYDCQARLRQRSSCDFYGIQTLLSIEEWQFLLLTAGFSHAAFEDRRRLPPHMWDDTIHHPDPVRLADQQTLLDPEIWRLSIEYDELLEKYLDYLGYAALIGSK